MYLVNSPYLLRKFFSRNIIWNIPTQEKVIYLTFDDGPIAEITPLILKTLKEFNAKATFFCVGENVKKELAIFDEIIKENHSVGNHTFNHLNGWKTKTKHYVDNVFECEKFFKTSLFRPPYGKLKLSQFLRLKKNFKIVFWSVLSGDFDQNTSKEKCLKNAIDNTTNGTVIVFHDNLKAKTNLYYALPKYLEHFSLQGYVFKAVAIPSQT